MNVLHQLAKIDAGSVGVPKVTNAGNVLTSVLNTVYIFAGIVCVIVIIVAGYIYVTSNGNATRIKRGKDAITYAVVGLGVIILAFTITQFVIGRF